MLSNITLGQFFPGESFLHKMDPRAKIVAVTIFITAIFLADTPIAYAIVTGVTLSAILLSRLPMRLLWQAIKPLWIIILFTLAIHVLTTPGNVLWQYSFLRVTEEGLREGES